MLERELFLADHRRDQASRDELAVLEPPQIRLEGLSILDERRHGPFPEDTPDHRGLLQRLLLARLERVDPGREHRLNGVRQLDSHELVRRPPAIPLPGNRALVDQVAQDLLEEERVAFRTLEDPRPGLVRQPIDVEQMPDESLRRLGCQRAEEHPGEAPPAATPGRMVICQLRSSRTDEEQRALGPFGDLFEHVEQHRVGPVNVVDDDDERSFLCDGGEEDAPGSLQLDAKRGWLQPGEFRVSGVQADRERERRGDHPLSIGKASPKALVTRPPIRSTAIPAGSSSAMSASSFRISARGK